MRVSFPRRTISWVSCKSRERFIEGRSFKGSVEWRNRNAKVLNGWHSAPNTLSKCWFFQRFIICCNSSLKLCLEEKLDPTQAAGHHLSSVRLVPGWTTVSSGPRRKVWVLETMWGNRAISITDFWLRFPSWKFRGKNIRVFAKKIHYDPWFGHFVQFCKKVDIFTVFFDVIIE